MSDPNSPLDREAKRRLAVIRHVEEVSGNVALTCRYFGISRQAYYTWYRRYQADGVDGLRARSKRPKTSPRATHVEIVGKDYLPAAELPLRTRRRSPCTSSGYHDVKVSQSGVWRILKRLDLNRLPASQRYKRHDKRWTRYEKQLPGHRVQIDVKFIERIAGAKARRGGRNKFYQFTAIDDCTRLRVLRIYPPSTRRPPSPSSTTCCSGCRFGSRSSRPTTVPSSSPRSTSTSWTKASATSTSNPARHGSTARWNDRPRKGVCHPRARSRNYELRPQTDPISDSARRMV